MHNDIINELNICFDEFQELLLSNTYISQKTYENFLDKYKETLELISKDFSDLDELTLKKGKSILSDGYNVIERRNKKYINNKLIEYKDYFDNLFKGIDNKILLDEEQRKSILMDEDYSLIVAGAGSGKTTTIAAKVKYLIEKCNINPSDIVVISLTNNVTNELMKKINIEFKLDVDILTFNKLGMSILKRRTDKNLKIIDNDNIYYFVCNYVTNNLFIDKEKLKLFTESFDEYVNFDESIYAYDNFNDYYNNYINITYENNKDNLDDYILNRTKNRINNYKTIDGQKLKSKQEVIIANYLYRNGYNYKYESNKKDSYIPDFTIDNNGNKIYIEYYGLTKLEKNNKYSINDITIYNKLIKKKKQLNTEYGNNLIEIYADYDDKTNYIEILNKELKKRNIDHTVRTNKELFETLMTTYPETNYYKFIDLTIKFINKFKLMNYDLNHFNDLINEEKNDKLKNQLTIMKEIYIAYNKEIHNNNLIDFNDMINYSCSEIDKVKEYFNYKYIIIDEFQDISTPKYKLIKKLSDLYDAKIVAVGDDWQAIYSFSGADIDLLNNFTDVLGYGDVNKITNTYRNSQELIDIAGNFVSKNVEQFNKDLISNKHLINPVEICYYYKEKNKVNLLNGIINNLYRKNNKGNILLLGRFKSDINPFIDSPYFIKGPNDKIICKKCKKANIEFLTIHNSKGLGYDNVIILNGLNGTKGFPSKIDEIPILKVLNISKEEPIKFAEERRLFYVALTRTKKKVYILAPYNSELQSDFILEICKMDNVKENMNYVNKLIKKEK